MAARAAADEPRGEDEDTVPKLKSSISSGSFSTVKATAVATVYATAKTAKATAVKARLVKRKASEGFFTQLTGLPFSMQLSRRLSKEGLIGAPLFVFVLVFLTCNALCVGIFALLFYACGAECFDLSSDEFSFAQTLWVSIHTFTTVGYGTHSPSGDCILPQLLVFVEHFVGLLDVAVFTAMLLTKYMHPNPKALVRFSKNFLISDEDDGHRWLTLRLVRICKQPLRNCELSIMCGVAELDRNGVMSCSEKTLKVQTSRKNILETWFVRHRIDESSPLHQSRFRKLAFLNVTLTAFDTAYMEEARIFHSYVPYTDLVRNARFVEMKRWEVINTDRDDTEVSIREMHHHVDLSKLDDYVAYERNLVKSKTVFKAAHQTQAFRSTTKVNPEPHEIEEEGPEHGAGANELASSSQDETADGGSPMEASRSRTDFTP